MITVTYLFATINVVEVFIFDFHQMQGPHSWTFVSKKSGFPADLPLLLKGLSYRIKNV
jgi:hypothetical protein